MNTDAPEHDANTHDSQIHDDDGPEGGPDITQDGQKKQFPVLRLIRTLWLTAIAVGMVAAFFSGGQVTDWEEQNSSWDSAVDLASDRYEANETLTEGAPQQTVANGWHTNDLLEVQVRVAAESSGALHAEYRTGVILVFLLGLGLLGDRVLRIWDQQQAANQPSPGT